MTDTKRKCDFENRITTSIRGKQNQEHAARDKVVAVAPRCCASVKELEAELEKGLLN